MKDKIESIILKIIMIAFLGAMLIVLQALFFVMFEFDLSSEGTSFMEDPADKGILFFVRLIFFSVFIFLSKKIFDIDFPSIREKNKKENKK